VQAEGVEAMNKRDLVKLGVPEDCIPIFINTIRDAALAKTLKAKHSKKIIPDIVARPDDFIADPLWASCAHALNQRLVDERDDAERKPIAYKQWGEDIDDGSKSQMATACHLPSAVGAALMPDAHTGYGLPIGGVLALDNHVVPYGVGVDIACRMKLSIFDMPADSVQTRFDQCVQAIEKGTSFGVGANFRDKKYHEVMDMDWAVTPITEQLKDRAHQQLGTSGSGNHFVEFGTLHLAEPEMGLKAGMYLALLSHSGSRGAGANVCTHYTRIAQRQLPKRHAERFRFLAWLDLDTQEGQEYWHAMELMGEYAAANHAVIHRDVARLLGGQIIGGVENHHNFAWKEMHGGKELIVHRKGATPAGKDVLGVIPGSMADPCFVVRGRGSEDSLLSASHGAGRQMSRTAAKKKFIWDQWRKELHKRGVHLISGGLDEVPGAYKDIRAVMAAQTDLVDIVAQFNPKIVKMCGDGSRAED